MGGNSSKQKIGSASQSRADSSSTINTINDGEGGALPEGRRRKKKAGKNSKPKENKSSSYADKENKKKKKEKHSGCKNHKRISFEEKAVCGVGGGGGVDPQQRSRKKSACPSCDARDMLLDQVRSRSGSLRYTDFNTVVRQSRIYDLEEVPFDVPLDGVPDPLPEAVCFVCGVYTGSVTRTCRVCCHVYHNGCLHKIGQAMDQRALQLAQMDMWSCHQCSDVSRLLTREETLQAFNVLEGLNVDSDNITIKDYIEYKEKVCVLVGRAVTQEKKLAWIGRFNFVAGEGAGSTDGDASKILDWSQFLQAETISILRNRCKNSLVKLMTELEFAEARKIYRDMMGPSGKIVSMAQVKDRVIRLYTKFGISLWPEDEEDVESLDEQDFQRNVSWDEFLSILAIHMITVRENNHASEPSTEDGAYNHSNDNNNGVMTPSFDSVDDDDYRTCESDLDSPTATSTETSTATNETTKRSSVEAGYSKTLPRNKTAHKKNLSDVQILNESGDNLIKSLSILDDISKVFNLNGDGPPAHDNYNNKNGDENNAILKTSSDENAPTIEIDSSPASGIESGNISSQKRHLWKNSPGLLDNPNFTRSVDIPLSTENISKAVGGRISLESSPMITKRRSEVLVRPSTEEGRSPRRALSQKLVAPAYGLVDKMQTQDWNC